MPEYLRLKEVTQATLEVAQSWWSIFTPPSLMTVSQWADSFRKLSPEASAEPGQWDTARAEYQRGIMDAASDPLVHTLVVMASAQTGKSEVLNNITGYFIDQDPAPILLLQPTLEMAETWSKDRLGPMLRDTPVLQGKVSDPRSRDSGNTLRHKTFPGGHVTMAGANSPASLASRPVRTVLADEVDRYPASAGEEGDPVSLAKKRSTTFWNRLLVLTSTPTVKWRSRIEAAFEESDKRHFHVPCPCCGYEQKLVWQQVKWPEGHPSEAKYECEECAERWTDARRWAAIRDGKWSATAEFKGTAGFHLTALVSPWVPLRDVVGEFLDAKADPERLKVWTNTVLAETWEERGDSVEQTELDRLFEPYGSEALPSEINVLTAGVDTQDDRLECEMVGWGDGEESWGVEYHVIYGDPAGDDVWKRLDDVLLKTWQREDGVLLRVQATAIDSGGHFTDRVLSFAAARARRRVYAIKGKGGEAVPIWPRRKSKSRNTGQDLYIVGVDTAKDAIHARWSIQGPGPGYAHLPADSELGYDADWCSQVMAEHRVTRYSQGRPYTRWEPKKKRARNEALDNRVYAMAAMKSLSKRQKRPPVPPKHQPDPVAHAKPHTPQQPTTEPPVASKRSHRSTRKGIF